MTQHMSEREQSLLLRQALASLSDDTLLTAHEVALILTPDRPTQLRVYKLRRDVLRGVMRNKRNLRFRAADVCGFLNSYAPVSG